MCLKQYRFLSVEFSPKILITWLVNRSRTFSTERDPVVIMIKRELMVDRKKSIVQSIENYKWKVFISHHMGGVKISTVLTPSLSFSLCYFL